MNILCDAELGLLIVGLEWRESPQIQHEILTILQNVKS